MKDGVPNWSAVVIVPKGDHHILAVNRSFNVHNPALPGGDSENADESPAQTARRELFEETGVKGIEFICIDRWKGERGQPVFAFFVPQWKASRLRTSSEGKPYWTYPEKLLIPTAQYRGVAQQLLERLGKLATT